MKYTVKKTWKDSNGVSSSSRCGIFDTIEKCNNYIKKEEERLKDHKGCKFIFVILAVESWVVLGEERK